MKVEIWMILIWVFGFVLVVAALCKDYQDRMERKRAENNPKAIQQEQEQSEENLIERREKILCYAIDEHLRKVLKGEHALEIFLLAIYINMLAVNGGKWLALRNDLFYTISRKEGPQYSPVNHRSESPLMHGDILLYGILRVVLKDHETSLGIGAGDVIWADTSDSQEQEKDSFADALFNLVSEKLKESKLDAGEPGCESALEIGAHVALYMLRTSYTFKSKPLEGTEKGMHLVGKELYLLNLVAGKDATYGERSTASFLHELVNSQITDAARFDAVVNAKIRRLGVAFYLEKERERAFRSAVDEYLDAHEQTAIGEANNRRSLIIEYFDLLIGTNAALEKVGKSMLDTPQVARHLIRIRDASTHHDLPSFIIATRGMLLDHYAKHMPNLFDPFVKGLPARESLVDGSEMSALIEGIYDKLDQLAVLVEGIAGIGRYRLLHPYIRPAPQINSISQARTINTDLDICISILRKGKEKAKK